MTEKRIILDNIRSAHNVGSIFRTADGAGVTMIYLCGTTPAPIDRFGRVQKEIAKTSLGATESVSWEFVDDVSQCIFDLQQKGFTIVAVEQNERSVLIDEWNVPEKGVYIFGNEIDGVSEEVISRSDSVVAIPMRGRKESLNVSVAAGIVLFKE